MAWEAFLSAPVSVADFAAARDVLVKIVGNARAKPEEPKFRRVRPENAVLARVLFPQALAVLQLIGFKQQGEWLELGDEALPELSAWLARLSAAQLECSIPDGARAALLSGWPCALDLVKSRTVCRQWRRESLGAFAQEYLSNIPQLLQELCFNDWFALRCAFAEGDSDAIAAFHAELVDSPLNCLAGGAMRVHRPKFFDVQTPGTEAFYALNPWEMLKVGPYGLRARPSEPTPEWWAKLRMLLMSSEHFRGRQWQWSERSMTSNSVLHIRQIIYCVALNAAQITITMRAIWDSGK